MKTFTPKLKDIDQQWYVVDARNQILGRLATKVAHVLRGKHKPTFAPHVDVGDFVIIINADKVRVTGRKAEQKKYTRYSGYPGGLKEIVYEDLFANSPEKVLEHAIKGMLPKNRLGRQMYRKLKVYSGDQHPHHAQQPKELTVN
ncbi:50S ribosomal protein L13 [candidate division KSB1 bacterium 4572_119]|nr:MAG: 50S ribosomal protein L13 [candidate division KSB1 bacterium 4572_119]